MNSEIKLILKEKIPKILWGLTYIIVFLLVVSWLGLNKWELIAVIITISFCFTHYRCWKNKTKFPIKHFIFNSVLVACLILLYGWLRGFGVVGFVLILIIIPLMIIVRRWAKFMDAIRTCEKVIWGKTKEEMRRGERRPKIKIVWNKRDLGGKK